MPGDSCITPTEKAAATKPIRQAHLWRVTEPEGYYWDTIKSFLEPYFTWCPFYWPHDTEITVLDEQKN